MPVATLEDYYDILEVDPEAGVDEIRTSYQRLALAHHPDKQLQQQQQQEPTSNTASSTSTAVAAAANRAADARAFIRITEAWNTLRDAELRRAYDAELFRGRIDDVPMVHQVLEADEVRRTADGTGLTYRCRCGVQCRVDTHTRLTDDQWRFNACDECSHVVELDVEL